MISDYFVMSLKYLTKKKLRAWLTIIGIVLGTLTVVALIALGEGMQNAVEDQVLKLAGTKLRVLPGSLQGPPIGRDDITDKDAEAVRGIPNVKYVAEILINQAIIEFAREEKTIGVVGVNVDVQEEDNGDLGVELYDGRLFIPSDNKVAILGYDVWTERWDQEIGLRQNIEIDGEKFRVIGLYDKTGSQILDTSIQIPLRTAQDFFDQKEILSLLTVRPVDGVDSSDLAEEIIRKLKRTRDDENFEVYTAESVIQQINSILDIVKAILIAIASISLFVGTLGIMNSMFTSVYERTREIGIMKAIGAKNSDIFTIILIDSGIMGLVGGLLGAILGYMLAFLISFGASLGGFDLLTVELRWDLILQTMVGTFIIGMIAGLLPAIRAVHLKLVDALRYE